MQKLGSCTLLLFPWVFFNFKREKCKWKVDCPNNLGFSLYQYNRSPRLIAPIAGHLFYTKSLLTLANCFYCLNFGLHQNICSPRMIAPTTRDLMLIAPLLGFWFIPELLPKAECSNCLISDVYQHYCSPRLIALIDSVLVYTSAIAHQSWLFLLLEFWCIPVLLLTLAYCSYCSGSDLYQHYCSPRLIALIDWVLVYTSANAYLGWLLLLLGFWCIPVLLLTSANCFYCLGSDVFQYIIAYLGWLVLLLGFWCIRVCYCLPRLIVSIARVLMYTSIPLLTSADCFYCSGSDVYQYYSNCTQQ